MIPISLILLFCVIANLSLVAYVFWRRHTRPAHFAFAAVLFALGCWNLSLLGVAVAETSRWLTLYGRCAFVFGSLIGTSYLVFTWLFPEKNHPQPEPPLVLGVLTIGTVVTVLSATPLVQAGVEIAGLEKRPVFGPLHVLFVGYMLTVFCWSNWNLFRSRHRASSGRERMHLNYCLVGFVLAFAVVSFAHFVMPFVAIRPDLWLLGGGGASTLCITAMTSYAVFRHRLMDIGIAFRSVVIQLLMGLFLASFFFVALVLLTTLLGDEQLVIMKVIPLFLAIVLAAFVPALHRRISAFVDQSLFGGRYDHEGALTRFGRRLSGTYGRENIARLVSGDVPIVLQAEGSAIYLPDDGESGYRLFASHGLNEGSFPDLLDQKHPLLAAALLKQGAVLKDEVGQDSPVSRQGADQLLDSFDELGVEVAIALASKGRTLGVLFLGGKNKDDVYTSDDLSLLEALMSQAGFALDNTRLYEQFLEAQKHYEKILRHMQRGVLAVDTTLHVTTLNETGATILGVGGGDWTGRDLGGLVPSFADLLLRTLETKQDQPLLEKTIEVGGKEMPCECETSWLMDARDRSSGALIVFQDLTERKQFEVKVRRMDRLASVGTLAAGIAHEIKNPLVSIQTFAQLLSERYDDTEFRESFSSIVISEVNRINNLVRGLLDFARPQKQKPGFVEVEGILDKTLELLNTVIRKGAVELTRERREDLPPVFGDAEQLHQVFLNLIQNAVQAMEESGGELVIRSASGTGSRRAGESFAAVVLTISDTGSGIAEEDLQRIFDPFYPTKVNGCGLGLSISQRILEEHGASIDVSSQPRNGTTFTLALPIQMP
ncbi:MAG: GAF domain-containing protein [Lentisphaerae bacterium]|nr:GAF domain-containing protein [Lentisphaerota bacterium]MBT5604417.1 GAF domain-containing protein [Lentisphaerota bacterium]MBT7058174.1 GAF domain-containing protein [Lentisphaerota bacterium]MBT7847442.1 GAF domain-containing protein [Lentisphaerota bacterium]